MKESEFDFDAGDFEANKPAVFTLTNEGEQVHHTVFAKIPDNANLEELLAEDEPAGVTMLFDSYNALPGQSGDVTVAEPLAAGRYVMLCFLPDPPDDFANGTPHFMRGMIADFRIE